MKGSDIRGNGRRWVCEGLEALKLTAYIFRDDVASRFNKMNMRENLGRNDIQ
jgi:hypothetical protein